jgi:hypothetical protein
MMQMIFLQNLFVSKKKNMENKLQKIYRTSTLIALI